MFVPLIILPLVTQLFITVADGVPKLDVSGSCRGAAIGVAAADFDARLKGCLDSEERTRDALSKTWADYTPTDRAYCIGSIKGFEPTYTELATCLEMQQNLKTAKGANAEAARGRGAAPAATPAGASRNP